MINCIFLNELAIRIWFRIYNRLRISIFLETCPLKGSTQLYFIINVFYQNVKSSQVELIFFYSKLNRPYQSGFIRRKSPGAVEYQNPI